MDLPNFDRVIEPFEFPSIDDWVTAKGSIYDTLALSEAKLFLQITAYQHDRLAAFNKLLLSEIKAIPSIRENAKIAALLLYWKEIGTGQKISAALAKGREKQNGTKDAKDREALEIRQECEAVAVKNPRWKRDVVQQTVADRRGISTRTVRRLLARAQNL